jgi:hypothetical protein
MTKPTWYGHYIKKNHSERRPQDFVFVDVETSQRVMDGTRPYTCHSLKLGVACHVRWPKGKEPVETWYDFDHATHFWEWLEKLQSKKRVLWVIAHNACFDLTILGLWERTEQGCYQISRKGKPYKDSRTGEQRISKDWYGLLAIDGTPFHVETEGTKGRVNFSDLSNYYQCPLSDVANMLGMDKGQWHDVCQNDDNLRAYCHHDVEILKRAYIGLVKRWEDQHNGNWQFSAAGLAYSHYRHRYMNDAIAVHDHAEAMRIEWQSLYGGEVRCWFRGTAPGKVVHYDVNSLYPSVMVDNVFPTSLIDFILRPSRGIFSSLIDKYASVAEVDINTSMAYYPKRQGKRVIYPTGTFTTTLAGPELMSALERGHITHCYSLALYTYGNIFSRYVLEWYDEKQMARSRSDGATESFAKLMLNSLSAKFAQRSPVWVNDDRVNVVSPWKVFPFRCPDTGCLYPARSVGWIGQVMRERVPTDNSFPAIYAYVTAYAREKMRDVRRNITAGRVYYQDTDSLFVDQEASVSLDNGDRWIGNGLGQIRRIGEYNSAIFRGVKNYTVDGRHVIAGIKSRDIEIADMKWSAERWERSNAIFNRNPDGTVRTHTISVDTPGSESEGAIGADGWTQPLRLMDPSSKMLGIG